jgi:putative ABC transport system permease protein
MFDLETAITKWKKSLAANPGLEEGQRAELETCLRDEVADLVRRGRNPEEAFRQVSTEMGSPDEMGIEFFKVYAKRPFGSPSWKRTGFAPALLWNYVKIALRKIKRQKGYSVINIAGLAVGLAGCALMMLWVSNEKSFDIFHANRDSIYRVIKETSTNGKAMLDARTPYPLGPAILGKVPELLNYCRYQGFEKQDLKFGDKKITLSNNFGTADPSFFEMFSFPFVQGDSKTALAETHSIVLTESTARKIFGEEPPLGKILTYLGGWGDFKVTGVIRDIPENSHIRFDVMVPIKDIAPGKEVGDNDWEPLFFYSYVQLAPNSSAASAGLKIAAVLNENIPNLKADILLQPLREVHLKSNFQWDLDNYAQGSQSTLNLFTLAALGVLLLAMINFMNLSTARSANRAKEVGLRKVSGARRTEIMGQFLGESVLLAFLGLSLALILVSLGLPMFNKLAGKAIIFSGLFDPRLILGLVGMALLTGLLSGSYPSFFLSAFQPSRVLKGGVVSGGRGQAALRKILVVLQFALTLFFVMGTAVVGRQLKFVREKDLGIDVHNVVSSFAGFRDIRAAKNAYLSNPNVLSITLSEPPQKEQRGLSGVTWEGKNPGDESQFFPVTVDPDYLETFRVGLAEGRFFSREFPTDATEAVVLNQTAVRAMGMTSPLGKKVTIGRRTYNVIGVVKDFHQSSLHRPIEPMILRAPQDHWALCIRIRPTNVRETIAFLEATAKKLSSNPNLSGVDYRFEFLDDRIDGFYAAERKVEAVLGLFTAIALFTACLGLLGLASFLAEKRTKEIGIRKILGAPVSGLVILQTREFSKWILMSGLVAGPAAYYAAGRWLRGFAYHVNPSVGVFVSAIFATLVIALLAVGFQSVRAARANPVESLRHE